MGLSTIIIIVASAGAAPSPPRVAEPERPPLAGPAVAEPAASNPPLVAYDFAGKLRRTEVPPEVAAAALLELDASARSAIEGALAQRAAILDAFVRENLDLLTKVGTASATGDKLDLLGLGQQAYTELQPLREQGSLQAIIRAALPADAAARFDALLDEYWRAVVREGRSTLGENGKPRSGFEVVIEERFASLGREIERSFERQLRSGDVLFAYLTEGITLRPDQEARIRQAVADVVERHDVEASKPAQALLGASILAYLDPEQGAAFIARVKKLSE